MAPRPFALSGGGDWLKKGKPVGRDDRGPDLPCKKTSRNGKKSLWRKGIKDYAFTLSRRGLAGQD